MFSFRALAQTSAASMMIHHKELYNSTCQSDNAEGAAMQINIATLAAARNGA
jgi:hypothetical protein